MPESPDHFYFDTVTLSNFALAGRVGLLTDRYGPRAIMPSQVLDEILEGVAAGYDLVSLEQAVAVGDLGSAEGMRDEERGVYRGLLSQLSSGEAACIALASMRGGTVVTDDRAARTACAERGLAVTGTIGILKACVVDHLLEVDEADGVLQLMIDAGFYSPVRTMSSVM